MPEHASVLPRTRRGASSRPLAAALSIALALLGATAFALPASADEAPPDPLVTVAPVAGDGVTPVGEPTPSPAPTDEPTPTPTPSESVPAPSGDLGPAPMLATLTAAAPLAAPAAPSVPTIVGPSDITVNVGDNLNSLSLAYTASGPGTDRMGLSQRGTRPPGVNWSSGSAKFTGRPTEAGQWPLTIELSDNRGRVQATMAVTFTVTGPPTISGDFTVDGELGEGFQEDYTLGGYPLPAPADVSVTGLPAGLAASVTGTRLRISGTPTDAGRFAATVTATVAGRTALRNLTITVYGIGVAPSTTVTLARNVEMTPVTIPIDRYVGDASIRWSITRGALPRGISVDASDDGLTISGKPRDAAEQDVTIQGEAWIWGFGRVTGQTVVRFRIGDPPTLSNLPPRTVTAEEAMVPSVSINPTGAASLTTSALPDGLSLTRPGPAASWRLSGIPSRAAMGEHTITFNATNDFGTTSATLQLTVQAKPVITVSDQTFTSGGDASHSVTATGWPLPQLSVRAGDLPAGLTADGSTPGRLAISGSTTALGTSTIHVTASNGVGPAVETTYALSIVAAPVFTQETMALTLDAGQPMTAVELEAASFPPHTVALAPGSAPLPEGLSIDPASGILTGTPTAAAAGVHTVTVRAENGLGHDDLTLQITVLAAPEIASTSGSTTFRLNEASSFTITTSGWLPPTVTMSGLPDGLALERVDDTTWQVSGTVTDPGELGPHTVDVTMTNTSATVSRTMTLRVMGFAWLQVPGDLVVEAGKPITPFVVSATAFGEPGYKGWIDPYPYPHPWITCGLNWDSGNDAHPNTDTWTCGGRAPAAAGATALTFNVTYPVPIPARTIHVSVIERPVIVAPDATVVADDDVALPVTVTADPAPTSVTATGLPTGLSLEQATDGSWAIVGRVDRADVGVYEVTITAENGFTGQADVTLTVGSRPVLPAGDVTLVVGAPYSGSVAADGSPAPTLELTDDQLPDGLTWSAAGAVGTLEGTPTQTGEFSYTVTATNGHGTATQTYLVEVHEAAAFADDTLSLTMVEGVAASRTLPLVGFPYPAVTPTGTIPAGMTLAYTPGSAPVLAGTPAPGSAGTYPLVLTAANHSVLGDATDAVTIEITVQAAPTLAAIDPLEGTVGTVVDRPLVIGGAPAPTVTATGLPTGVQLVQDAGGQWHLAGTPAPGTGGRHTVTVTVDNGVLAPVTATTTVTVREPVTGVLAPVANLRVGTPAVVTVRAQGGWPAPAALSVVGTLPGGLRFVDQGDGTGQLLGTPTAGAAGSWQVTILGDNGVGTARTTLTLTIAAAPAAPVAQANAPAAAQAADPGTTPPPADPDDDDQGDDPAEGDGDGEGAAAGDDEQAAPPVLDPEETISVERGARPWWWILGAVLVGAVLLGLRALERKLRSI